MSDERKACVVDKTCDDGAHQVHLETEDGTLRVVVPVPVDLWHRIDFGLSVQVPEGDLNSAQVQAGIRWPF